MKAMVVRRRDIERPDRPAGAFRSVAIGGRALPRFLLGALGSYCVDTAAREFALTYDDGPHPETTPRVLDVLADHGAVATFFVLGEAARRHPDVLRRTAGEGHEIALHGMDHRSLLTMSTREAARQIRDSRALVEDIVGQRVALYRPPYGEHGHGHARAVRRQGLELTIWSGAAEDWIDDAEESIASRGVAAVFPGAIVLLHDTRADPETLAEGERLPAFDRGNVLDRILRATSADGFTPVTAGELLRKHTIVKSLARERMVLG